MNVYSSQLTEKVSVNVNTSTLAAIDLLVDHGYFSNRSDFINQALREAVQGQGANIQRISRQVGENLRASQWFMGLLVLTEADVDELLEKGKTTSITGYGVLCIDHDIPEEKLFAAVEKISVRGKVACTESVKVHYLLK